PVGSIEFPVDAVHADVTAISDRAFEVSLDHDVPGFRRYFRREAPFLPWRPVEGRLLWNLVPGENVLEIRAENGEEGTSRVTLLRASLASETPAAPAPYAGLRAPPGDPH